jgi:hypothetical protein
MQSDQTAVPSLRQCEILPLNRIRVETALSRYPVHRLAKKGIISINLKEQNEQGATTFKWKVSHNSEYGQPGPLAYKVDTLIINRRIEEASRPIPKIIKLGSLREIAADTGTGEGNTSKIKQALYQNAAAFITAKVRYKLADGTKKTIEFGDTRYAVVFTGERLPDGRTADAVYIILHEFYREILDNVLARPLDYDYLKQLPPASQRLYELLSFQVFAALNHKRRTARLVYSELCTHAPLTRHSDWLHVRTQMNKIHRPHMRSGYLAKVQYDQTTDAAGGPDWLMIYTPGPKAEAEFRAFTKRGEPRTLDIQQARPAQAEPNSLECELTSRGVTVSTAHELVTHYPAERITAQLEHFDWLKEKHPKKVRENPGGYLAAAIRGDYAPVNGFETKAQRIEKANTEACKKRDEAAAKRRNQAEKERERAMDAQVKAFWQALSAHEQTALDAEALKAAPAEIATQYAEQKQTQKSLAEALFKISIREPYIKAKLRLRDSEPEEKTLSQPRLFD